MTRLTVRLHDQAIAERNAGGPSLGPYLKEAARLLEQLAEGGVEISGNELRLCSYPEFDIHAAVDVDWRTAAMLYPLLMLAWPAVAPAPDKRGFVSATLPAADFLPRVREIMGDAQQVAAILGL